MYEKRWDEGAAYCDELSRMLAACCENLGNYNGENYFEMLKQSNLFKKF